MRATYLTTIHIVVAALSVATPAVAQVTNDPFLDPTPASKGVIVVGLEEFAVLRPVRRTASSLGSIRGIMPCVGFPIFRTNFPGALVAYALP